MFLKPVSPPDSSSSGMPRKPQQRRKMENCRMPCEANSTDFHEILDVDRNASKSELQRAYNRLMKKYSQETKPGNKADLLNKESEACDSLRDDKRRNNYDAERTGDRIQSCPGEPGTMRTEWFAFSSQVTEYFCGVTILQAKNVKAVVRRTQHSDRPRRTWMGKRRRGSRGRR